MCIINVNVVDNLLKKKCIVVSNARKVFADFVYKRKLSTFIASFVMMCFLFKKLNPKSTSVKDWFNALFV